MVLWQAIAVAAVLSAFSAGIAIATRILIPGPDGRPTASIVGAAGRLGLAVVDGLHRRLRADRAGGCALGGRGPAGCHRQPAAACSPPDGRRPRRGRHGAALAQPCARARDLRVLDVAEPLAYCLPGVRSRVVVSEGTLTTLSNDESRRSYARAGSSARPARPGFREAFTAVHAAFPRLVRSSNALGAVQLLVELLADDAAVRVPGALPWPARWSPAPPGGRRRARWPRAVPAPWCGSVGCPDGATV